MATTRRRGPFADPGYQPDKRKRYQLDTVRHIETAWSFMQWSNHYLKYTPYQRRLIKARIRAAAKAKGIVLHHSR